MIILISLIRGQLEVWYDNSQLINSGTAGGLV